MAFEYIDTRDAAGKAIAELRNAPVVALDCEGDSLSRRGALTVLTLCEYKNTIIDQRRTKAYVFDIQVLGSHVFELGLKAILESESVLKLTYDCRQDSDALWHQFRVLVTNVIDCQVYDQACRLWRGDDIVRHTSSWKTYLPKMSVASERYFSSAEMKELDVNGVAPHKRNSKVWVMRPLSASSIEYAALDAHTINRLYLWMQKWNVCHELLALVTMKSKANVCMFRERAPEVDYFRDKNLCAMEQSIVPSFARTPAQVRDFKEAKAICGEEQTLLLFEKVDEEINRVQAKLPSVIDDDVSLIERELRQLALPFRRSPACQAKLDDAKLAIEAFKGAVQSAMLKTLDQAMELLRPVEEPAAASALIKNLETAIVALEHRQHQKHAHVEKAKELLAVKKRLADSVLFTRLGEETTRLKAKGDQATFVDLLEFMDANEKVGSKYPGDQAWRDASELLKNVLGDIARPFHSTLMVEAARLREQRKHGVNATDVTALMTVIARTKAQTGLLHASEALSAALNEAKDLLNDLDDQLVLQEQLRLAELSPLYFENRELVQMAVKIKSYGLHHAQAVKFLSEHADLREEITRAETCFNAPSRDLQAEYQFSYDDERSHDSYEESGEKHLTNYDFEYCDKECGYCGQCASHTYVD